VLVFNSPKIGQTCPHGAGHFCILVLSLSWLVTLKAQNRPKLWWSGPECRKLPSAVLEVEEAAKARVCDNTVIAVAARTSEEIPALFRHVPVHVYADY
jgi:hypothetical protein